MLRVWIIIEVTLVRGPAGTGKTILALQTALKLYQLGQIDKIYYVRNDPDSDLGSKDLGALPGTKEEKLAPLLGPILDNIYELCSYGKAKYIIDKEIIEVIPFQFLRGRSLMNKFVIADEMQNVPPQGILTLLTRLGRNTRMVLMGDSKQKDTKGRYGDGLNDAWTRLRHVDGVGLVTFGLEDIQRSGIIKDIMIAYDY